MYPLKIEPIIKNYIWGTESWAASCHPDGASRIANGPLAGKTLENAVNHLPLLFKIIDANDNLSVQVHPGDAYARQNENGALGKTELWYVLDAKPNSKLVYGLKKNTTKEDFIAAVEKGTVERQLNYVDVKKGDCFFIPAGLVHAIGKGITLAEIQQSSNLTYRIYDYNRVDSSGSPRELHIAKSLDVIDFRAVSQPAHTVTQSCGNTVTQYVNCDYFTFEKVDIAKEYEAIPTASEILYFAEGNGTISGEIFAEGDTFVIPAEAGKYRIEGKCTVLKSSEVNNNKFRLGIDLGGTGIKVGLVDKNGTILHKDSVPTDSARDAAAVIKDMADLCVKVVEDAGKTMDEIEFIGIGCPGSCDVENGVVIYSNNIDWDNVPLVAEMRKYIDKPMKIGNDANCAALGESIAGAAKGTRHSVMITLGTGVGGGIIINNEIYAGFNGAGAELGHVVLVVDGEPCTCGRNGCFESYASATALKRMTLEAANRDKDSVMWELMAENAKNVSGRTAFDAARRNDRSGQEVVNMYIKYLSEGLVDIINTFQPEVLIIGGGVSGEGDNLLKPLKEQISKRVYTRNGIKNTEIIVAKLGNDAGIIGSAYLD